MKSILPLKKTKPDLIFLGLLLILGICYLLGMKATDSFQAIQYFDSGLTMDTAQVARNTIRGDFFITKYILPVSYTYFPTIQNHPDFIRYPLPILLDSLLFLLTTPNPLIIKIFNGLLFLVNGGLIYRFVLTIQNIENVEINSQKFVFYRLIAFFTSITASIFSTNYFQMALSDNYEVFSYTLLLIIFNVLINKNTKPLLLGSLCGLLYLSKPTFSLFIVVFTLYYLFSTKSAKNWFTSGLLCALGFLIIVSPFIIRSYLLTGEPIFALQHKIDNIKGITFSHDELYKSFSKPPSLISTILHNKNAYFHRWQERVISAVKVIFGKNNIIFWIGLPFFLFHFKRQRWLAFSYLIFLGIHIFVVANYLEILDTNRAYTPILCFLAVLGYLGIYKSLYSQLIKLRIKYLQYSAIIVVFISLFSLSAYIDFNGGLKKKSNNSSIPPTVVNKIREIDPPCLYSNSPFQSAWYLDIPTIYKPLDDYEMLSTGPDECKYFLFKNKITENSESLLDFLGKNGELLYQYGEYRFYKLSK